jgi:hypothetical protein
MHLVSALTDAPITKRASVARTRPSFLLIAPNRVAVPQKITTPPNAPILGIHLAGDIDAHIDAPFVGYHKDTLPR